jgi:hypothetical protein
MQGRASMKMLQLCRRFWLDSGLVTLDVLANQVLSHLPFLFGV